MIKKVLRYLTPFGLGIINYTILGLIWMVPVTWFWNDLIVDLCNFQKITYWHSFQIVFVLYFWFHFRKNDFEFND